jgi:hypothetical protein
MTDIATERPVARPTKRQASRLLGIRRQLTPEEIAARNAAQTAKKIKEIFSRNPK